MCARTDSARELRDCAERLLKACAPIKKIYDDTVKEDTPEDMQALLNKLK